ncbi:flagellar motor switch protein FliN [Azospirillum sp. TSH7]|jgi:flagellar motor switch protein FliN/FliY|uniref:Flagellar motor switch protein FliN n=1 Tax=Azospirillum lipoferum TaxID=193 RepID=A0A5A9GHP2_AZOLI|nr:MULTISPECIES: flagellar motor switch protein FliN [Azospirillum]KAA0593252.1 flagellar motor switch protein FliN [Azospirillum lipoferum]MCP1613667.1 flagellar motor switch protein FliN/FliY [Azospirillum lipoferum]MDW5532428.1 flagellar motor switch protein FliN [Azospirillum sp. NL1]PWC58074.1 flagellar motor switch protein FliN [Azospirillum sp. TSH20]PWC61469.1 flagellar motor switch protein FliN [Azospirillum sp. TSH7]
MANIDDLLGAPDPNDGDAASFAIGDAPVEIKVVIGTAMLRVRDLLKLGRGAVVELDRHLKDPTDVYVEGVLVARGEVAIIDDKIGVTLTDFIKSSREWKR